MKRRTTVAFCLIVVAGALTLSSCTTAASAPAVSEVPVASEESGQPDATPSQAMTAACAAVSKIVTLVHEASIGVSNDTMSTTNFAEDIEGAQRIAATDLGGDVPQAFVEFSAAVASVSPEWTIGEPLPYEPLEDSLQPVRTQCLDNGTEVVVTMQGG